MPGRNHMEATEIQTIHTRVKISFLRAAWFSESCSAIRQQILERRPIACGENDSVELLARSIRETHPPTLGFGDRVEYPDPAGFVKALIWNN